jgi:hypothetical protein
MRRLPALLLLAPALFAAEDRPPIRAVTAFIELDKTNYVTHIETAAKFLATAKSALNAVGFEGAGITTQPFPNTPEA